ncbi:MAG: hypothetical protein AAGC56_13005 [Pseudomonadota bacterium]
MEFWDFLGFIGLAIGAGAYYRVEALEKKLKSLNVLESDYSAEKDGS